MKYLIFLLICTSSLLVSAQGNMTWFEATSDSGDAQSFKHESDNMMQKAKLLQGSAIEDKKFKAKPFFVYTHPQVRQYMTNEYLMECMAYVNKVGENTFLILEYKINSDKAKINYGNLEKGGKIKVSLMNNDHVYLENIERSRGKVRRSDKYTKYTGTYAITKTNIAILRKHNIDKIAVLWEEGVEEYEVQNIDLVKNQLNYLEKEK